MSRWFLLSICCSHLVGLPLDMRCIEGDASTLLNLNSLEISAKDGTVLEWDSFSIAKPETVFFHLPSCDASVLNRVAGTSPSEIFGSLISNGKVILMNPNGILFGPESRIDVANLVAASFDLFEKGGRIQHAGKIFADRIELMADEIYLFKNSICTGEQIYIGDREKTTAVWVDKDSFLCADGLNGGEVFVLSHGMTEYHGQISAVGENRGGFVEVSGGLLVYDGFSDLRGGVEAGTILLDPTDITIGPATANNTTTAGFSFPLSCGGISPISTQNATTAPFLTSTIDIATLTGQIGGGNVIVDSTTGGAGTGNITWNAGADFAYTSANSLVLRAPAGGVVTILSNVQNAGTGAVIIDSQGSSVLINTSANAQAVSFGSLNGLTQICAPNATVVLQGGSTGTDYAQVGFFGGDITATGPIQVICDALNVFGSTVAASYAHIGHGRMAGAGSLSMVTTPTATIDVQANGNINLLCSSTGLGASTRCGAMIGHGQLSFTGPPPPLNLIEGDITVLSGGSITITTNPLPGAIGCVGRIGHGTTGVAGASNFTSISDIYVEAAGDITLQYAAGSAGSGHICSIGHTSAICTLTGDVTVISGGNITMTGNPGAATFSRATIGQLAISGATAVTTTSNTRVFACRDINLVTNNSDVFGIGFVNPSGVNTAIGDVEVVAGGNLSLISNGTSNAGRIGNNFTAAASVTRTFVLAGNDVTISGAQSGGIAGFGDIYVAAGQNINLTAASTNTSFIGTDATNTATQRLTRVFAGGNVIASNPIAGGRAVIGRGLTPSAIPYTCALDLRAVGDIQLSFPFSTNAGGTLLATSGDIFIEADTQFATGALATADAASVISICTVAPNLAIPRSPVCPTVISSDSLPIPTDTQGAIRFDTGGNAIPFGIQTTVGNITLHSAQFQTSGSPQNLTIGTGVNNANILTTSGDIEIWGTETSTTNCVRGNSFNNITIDMALTTSGSVFISANNNMFMTSSSSIDTSSGGSPVTLIVDNQAPVPPFIGPGFFQMDAGSTIASGGLLQIYTALQNANSINGMLNSSTFAPGALFVDTNQEIWCTYFCAALPGNPFTVSYKNCLQVLVSQAMVIADQLLVNLHPYNEFPGWRAEFDLIRTNFQEPYLIRRRNLNLINHPKSWTILLGY